jgi:hypothetical protein
LEEPSEYEDEGFDHSYLIDDEDLFFYDGDEELWDPEYEEEV